MIHLSNRLLVFFIVLIFGVTSGKAAQQPHTKKLSRSGVVHGFCCTDGQIIATDNKNCLSYNGSFFADKRSAKEHCSKQPHHQKDITRIIKPVRGYCCDKAKVSSATEQSCQKKNGYFSTSKDKAEKKCAQTRGFCCSEGKYRKTTKRKCDHERGEFFVNKKRGFKTCQATKGFCCDDKGAISEISKVRCDHLRGTFYSKKQKANNTCKQPTLKKTTNTSSIHPSPPKPLRNAGQYKRNSLPFVGRIILPDLIVSNTSLDQNCFLRVSVKNIGGPISDKDHNKAKIHISAGPGNVLSKKKQYLRVIDPKGKLKRANSSVSYTTNLKVVGKQATLVWLDTGHHITESKENNNGDDREVTCKTMQVPVKKVDTSPIPLLKTIAAPPTKPKPVDQEPKDGVMYNLTRSITVISPKQGDFLTQGDQVDIIWNVEGDLETDCMNISLRQDAGTTIIKQNHHDTRQGTSTHYQQGITWNTPTTPNLQGPAYWVRVETCDGTVAGNSGTFLFPGINPEYSVNNIHISPSSPYVGDTINIIADIANMGGLNSNSYQSFTLEYNVYEGAFGHLQTIDSVQLQAPLLGFGAHYQLNLPYTLTKEGPHSIYLRVESYPGGESMDPYQANNYGWFNFTVGPEQLPDLIVCMKKHNRVNPPGTFTFPARVENIGNTISTPAKLSFFVTGNGTRHYDVPALQPGQISVPQRSLYWASTGSNHFELHIDYNDKVEELSNDNNILVGKIVRGKYGTLTKVICSDHPDAATPVP